MNAIDRDQLIRDALTPAANVQAPFELGDEIYRAVIRTPQRRAGGWLVGPGRVPAMAGLWLLLIVSILLAGLVFAIGSQPPSVELPRVVAMYHGGPERTGVMPGPGPAGAVEIGWTVSRGGAIPFNIMPVVANGTVFVGDAGGTVAAHDVGSGELRWESPVGSALTASPVLTDGLVVVGTEEGRIVALDAMSGEERWSFGAGSRVGASLAALDGTLFAGTDEGILYALDAPTGSPMWSHTADGALTRGPAIADGFMYLGAAGGQLVALDLDTRAERWVVELGSGELATPAVADGTVYTATGLGADVTHELVALDAENGSQRWAFSPPSGQPLFVSAVGDGLVYTGAEDFNVYALDAATGALRWTFETDGIVGSLATLVDGVLYVPSADQFVYALDAASGAERWRVRVQGNPTIPVVLDGRVIVGTDLGSLIAIVGPEEE